MSSIPHVFNAVYCPSFIVRFFFQQPVQVSIIWNGWFLPKKMETDLWGKDEINRLTHLNLLGPGTFKEPSFLGYQVFLTFSGVGVCFTCCLLPWIYETSNPVILLSVWHRLGRVWHPKSPNHQGFFGVTKIPKKLCWNHCGFRPLRCAT